LCLRKIPRRGGLVRHFSAIVRGKERVKPSYAIGEQINGFTCQKVEQFADFECTGFEFIHNQTGTKYVHIDTDDTENTFVISFKTVPEDDTGVPHILEHTVLCGSEKYPVRDPFFNMLKRSLQTFMNAFTSSDWTAYPFATQNQKDFENLLSVYLDATFFPKLRRNDFLQEGHRLEMKESENGLKYAGVVFNEMKGAMSDPDRIFVTKLTESLFPDTPYSYNSGGDPAAIPNLTYEQFCNFHKKFYHPSNSNVFTYGDLPPHFEQLGEVLSQFSKADPVDPVQIQPKFDSPRKVYASCPEDAMIPDPERQTKVLRTWIGPPIGDEDTFAMHIVSSLLLDDPSAPFYRSLIEPNIGQSFAPATGYSSDEKESVFGVGLSGIRDEDIEKVEQIITETLEKVVETGFDSERIEAIIHQIELSQKHKSTGVGLDLFLRMSALLNHGEDQFETLRLNEKLTNLRENLEKGKYFEGLIEKYLLNNQHSVTLVMNPDANYLKALQITEEEKLSSLSAELTEDERQNILLQSEGLKKAQEEKQDSDVLPTLTVKDIPVQGIYYDTHEFQLSNGLNVMKSVQPTNGMVYLKTAIDLHGVPEHLRPYLPLFTSCLSSMGAGELDVRQLAQELKLKTGDIGVSAGAMNSVDGMENGYRFQMTVGSSCLVRNLSSMFELYNMVLREPNFRFPDRLESIVSDFAYSEASSVVDSGHKYAMEFAAANFSPSHAIGEQLSGLAQVRFLNKLASEIPNNLEEITEKLEEIAKIVLQGVGRSLVVTDEKTWNSGEIERLLETLPAGKYFDFENGTPKVLPPAKKSYISIPMQVNHNALVMPSVHSNHPDAPALTLVARLLRWNYLHQQIREKGGAYGAGSSMGSEVFAFFSYRDPNVDNTLEQFSKAVDWVCSGQFSDRDVDECLLSVFADVDSPVAPSRRGTGKFNDGMTNEERQKKREAFLGLTKDKLVKAALTHLKPGLERANIAVCGMKDVDLKSFEEKGFEIISMGEDGPEDDSS